MNATTNQVYLVDDEPAVLKALSRLLRASGFQVRAFNSVAEFLAQFQPEAPACLVLDLTMPGYNGLELQQQLALHHDPLPVIFLSAHGDVPATVQAMKTGAVDFLTKPVDEQVLVNTIHEALRRGREARAKYVELADFQKRLATLTPREREVLEHVVTGKLNKQIGGALGAKEKTIKVHRGRVMEKMGVHSLAELVRLTERTGLVAPPQSGADYQSIPTSPAPSKRPSSPAN
jgi:FixJ family two-component response regulator